MTATTRLNRHACVKRLKGRLGAAAQPGVLVSRGVDRERPTDLLISIGDVFGAETGVPTMRRGRKHYDDTFRIEVICVAWAEGTDDFDVVDELAEQLAELVRDQLAEHPQLDDDGGNALPGLSAAWVSLMDGPGPWRTETGIAAAMRLEITCTSRIT